MKKWLLETSYVLFEEFELTDTERIILSVMFVIFASPGIIFHCIARFMCSIREDIQRDREASENRNKYEP